MCQVKDPTSFNTLAEVAKYFDNEKTCLKYIEKWLWKGQLSCPDCGCAKIYRCKDGKLLKCSDCKRIFSLLVGTIFENTQLSLTKWFMAIYLVANNKKGISTRQLASYIGTTQKTAWYLLHRIRLSMQQSAEKISGEVQIDETFVGGRNKNRHIDKKVKNRPDRTFIDKHTVLGIKSDTMKLKCFVIEDTTKTTLQKSVIDNVEPGAAIVTDEWKSYVGLENDFIHSVVNHNKRQFTSSEGKSTNGIENVWSHLKRMFYGTYNFVTKKHIQKYLDEFAYRYNNINITQSDRFSKVFNTINKTITYKKLVYG